MSRLAAESPEPGVFQNIESNTAEIAGQRPAARPTSARFEQRLAIVVLVLTAVLYFARLGARALWASEFRWGEIAREMLLTHHYFWPTINGRVYFDKPLGSYWLVVASTWFTGHMNEAAARIPSAAAGLVAVALIILLGRRLYDLRTGVIAGFILATSFSFAFWARTASADVETVAGELAALLIFVNNQDQPGRWVIWMWLVMALTSLMKGLLGFVLPLLVIGAYSCLADGWPELVANLLHGSIRSRLDWLIERNRWFFNHRTIIAVILAGGIYFLPFAISYANSGSTNGMYMVYRENVERYFAPFDHRGPIYLYVFVIFELMAPWSVFLPAALVQTHTGRPAPSSTRSDRFVTTFFWTIFIFFTLSGSRRSYYLLPILPAAAILVARIFLEKQLREASRLLTKIGFGIVVSALILALALLLPPHLVLPHPYSLLPGLPHPAVFIVCWVIAIVAAVYTCLRYHPRTVLISMCIGAYLLLGYLFIFALPTGDRWRGERHFAEATRDLIDGHQNELASFKTEPPVFYLGYTQVVPEYDTLADLNTAVRSGRTKWIIVRQRDVTTLDFPAERLNEEPGYPWDSPAHRNNLLILMEVKRQPL